MFNKKKLFLILLILMAGFSLLLVGCPINTGAPLYGITAPKVFSDGSGNFLAVYEIHNKSVCATFMRKLNSQGKALWGNSIQLYPTTWGLPVYIQNLGNGESNIFAVLGDGLWMQRLDANGNFLWQPGALPGPSVTPTGGYSNNTLKQISNKGNGFLTQYIEDQSGNVIVVQGGSNDQGKPTIFLQKVDKLGNLLWNNADIPGVGRYFKIALDNDGNIFLAWINLYFYIQKFNGADGQTLWPSPIKLPDLLGMDSKSLVVSDREGGCIAAWEKGEEANQSPGHYLSSVLTRRINAAGQTIWQQQNGPGGTLGSANLWRDDSGGAYLVAEGGKVNNFIIQHIKSDGTIDHNETYSSISCSTGDGHGGLGFVYKNANGGFVQHLEVSGEKPWGEPGVPVKQAYSGLGYSIDVMPDGSGGFIISWLEGFNGRLDDVYSSHVQQISTDGKLLWGENGIRLDQ